MGRSWSWCALALAFLAGTPPVFGARTATTKPKSQNLDLANTGPAKGARTHEKEVEFSLRPTYTADDNARWEIGGSADVFGGKDGGDSFVRLTQTQAAQAGSVFSRRSYAGTDWEVILEFAVGGGLPRGGGEGMAFWFTKQPLIGPVLGGADFWDGLGILIDTLDNDKNGGGPLITGVYNDGSVPYSAHDDGASQSVGHCHANLRNKPVSSFLRITYLDKSLVVEYATEVRSKQPFFKPCFALPIDLGVDKHFGVTASTGRPVAGNRRNMDNHDLYRLEVFSLAENTDEAVGKRREEYERETRETHSQMHGQHHEMNEQVFRRETLSSLNQLASTLTSMDSVQLKTEKSITASDLADRYRMSSGIVMFGGDGKEVEKVTKALQEALRKSVLMENQAASKIVGAEAVPANTLDESVADFRALLEESGKELDQFTQLQRGFSTDMSKRPRGRSKGPDITPTVRLANMAKQEIARFREQENAKLDDLKRSVSDLSNRLRRLMKEQPEQSRSGGSWLPSLVLLITTLGSSMVFYQQVQTVKMQGGGGRQRSASFF